MPAQRTTHGSVRERDKKPYDRPPQKPRRPTSAPNTANATAANARSGGGLNRSVSLLGGIARLVSSPFEWFYGSRGQGAKSGDGEGAEQPEGREEDAMQVEEEAGASGVLQTGNVRSAKREKRRQSSPGASGSGSLRKRPRLDDPAAPSPAGPSRGYADIPDLQGSLARKRQDTGRMPPAPKVPARELEYSEEYDPRFQHLRPSTPQQQGPTAEREVMAVDMHGVQGSTSNRQPPFQLAPTPSHTSRTPFALPRSSSVQPQTSTRDLFFPGQRGGTPSGRSDMMSVDGAPRRGGQMVWAEPSPLTPTRSSANRFPRPPSPNKGDRAEQILRALESFKTPLSSARAPVLPASAMRVHVPKPDTVGKKAGEGARFVGSPYERPVGEKEKRKSLGKRTARREEAREEEEEWDGMDEDEVEGVRMTSRDRRDAERMPPPPVPAKARKPKTTAKPASKQREDAEKERAESATAEANAEAKEAVEKAVQATPAPIVPIQPIPAAPASVTTAVPIPQPTIHPAFQAAAASISSNAPAADTGGFHVVDSYEQKGRSSLRIGKELLFRKHQSAAGTAARLAALDGQAKGEGQATKNGGKRGGNVFRMPDDEDDEMDEKTDEKEKEVVAPSTEEVAEWFRPPAEGEVREPEKEVGVKIEKRDFFADSIKRLEAKVTTNAPPSTVSKFGFAPAAAHPPTQLTQPTQVMFSANVSTAQPTLTFGAASSTPAWGVQPEKPAEAPKSFGFPPPAPPATGSTPFSGFGAPKKQEQPMMFGVKPPEPAPSAAPPMREGPSPFAALLPPKPVETDAKEKATEGAAIETAGVAPQAKPAFPGTAGLTFGALAQGQHGSSPFGGPAQAGSTSSSGTPAQPATTTSAPFTGFSAGPKFSTPATQTTQAKTAFAGFGQPAKLMEPEPAPSSTPASTPAFGSTFGGFGSSFTSGPIQSTTTAAEGGEKTSQPQAGRTFGGFGQPAVSTENKATTTPAPSTTAAAAPSFGASFSFPKPGDAEKSTSPFGLPTPGGGTPSFGTFGKKPESSGTTAPAFGAPALTSATPTPAENAEDQKTSTPAPPSLFGLPKPAENAAQPAATSGPAFGSFGANTNKASAATPSFGSFGGSTASTEKPKFGSSFSGLGQPSGSSAFAFPQVTKPPGANVLGLSTEVAAGQQLEKAETDGKLAPGSTATRPHSVFGYTTPVPTTPARTPSFGAPPISTTPASEPLKGPSPDKMETSPVHEFKPTAPGTTTPFGAPPAKPAFPSFGSGSSSSPFGTPGTSVFGSAANGNKPNNANPFGNLPAATPGSAFNFSFSTAAGSSNPFGAAPPSSSTPTFGSAFGQPPAAGSSSTTPTAFGAPTTTPERPSQPGAGGSFFGAAPTAFSFGAPGQSSPFGANTPPLAFGQAPAAAPGSDAGSPQLNNAAAPGTPGSGIFNLGAADSNNANTPRKVKGLPLRRKRM